MPQMTPHALAADLPALRLLRPRKTAALLDISLTTLWRLSHTSDFPKKYQLGPNAVAFRESELQTWIAQRRTGGGEGSS